MRRTILQLTTPMFCLIAVVLGSGLLTTLVPIRLEMEGYSEIIIGIVSSAFYAGLIFGSFKVEPIVSRIGHIRAYSFFAALLAIVTLLQGMFGNIEAWLVLRLVTGFCMSGLFVIIESWFLVSGPFKYRGRLLALYMTSLYAAQSGGQVLLYYGDVKSLELFCVVTILTCLSIIPLTLTRLQSPEVHEPSALGLKKLFKISPTGICGAICGGMILGCMYGLMPVYVSRVGYSVDDIAIVMGLIILGAMILQYPMGRLSDLFDRRRMMIVLCCTIVIISLLMILFSYMSKTLFFCFSMLYGGLVFVLYPLSISHTCDYVKQEDIIGATQGLLLYYGIGAMIGPIFAAALMQIQPTGLFFFISVLSGVLAYFIYWRGNIKPSLPLEKQHEFAISSSTTPIASTVDSRLDNEEQDSELQQ